VTERQRSWAWFFAMVAFIILTLELMSEISLFLRVRGYQQNSVTLALVSAVLGVAYFMVVGARIRNPLVYLRAALPVAAFVVVMVTFRTNPQERFHFVEYGVLYLLALRAIVLDVRGLSAYLLAAAATILAGWFDEYAQDFVETRYFDWADVRMNALAAGMAALVYLSFFGRRPELARFEHLPSPSD